ncbi:hypothetical protein ACFS07_06295 [Undibacterium arcticum]
MNIYLLQVANGVGIGMLYFLLAVGLSIVFGLLRFVNFFRMAHFFSCSAPISVFQLGEMGLNFWWSLLVAPLAVGAFAWLIEKNSCCDISMRCRITFIFCLRSGLRWYCKKR